MLNINSPPSPAPTPPPFPFVKCNASRVFNWINKLYAYQRSAAAAVLVTEEAWRWSGIQETQAQEEETLYFLT